MTFYISQATQCRSRLDFWCPADEKCLQPGAKGAIYNTKEDITNAYLQKHEHYACFDSTFATAPTSKKGENVFGKNGSLFLGGCLYGHVNEEMRYDMKGDSALDTSCANDSAGRCLKGCSASFDPSKCSAAEVNPK